MHSTTASSVILTCKTTKALILKTQLKCRQQQYRQRAVNSLTRKTFKTQFWALLVIAIASRWLHLTGNVSYDFTLLFYSYIRYKWKMSNYKKNKKNDEAQRCFCYAIWV